MTPCVILVDNTNLFIGGQDLAAERHQRHQNRPSDHGSDRSIGPRREHQPQHHTDRHSPSDASWRLDFRALLECLAKGRPVHAAIMVGSHPEDHSGSWEQAARAAGFKVYTHETNARHQEKAVDTELVAPGTEIMVTAAEPMVLVLASGDRDTIPLVEIARQHGWEVELCAFKSSYTRDGELASAVDRVRPLDDCFDQISHYEEPHYPEGRHHHGSEHHHSEHHHGELRH